MSIPYNNNIAKNERDKFRDAGGGQSAVAVVGASGEVIGNGMWSLPYDTIVATYPTDTTEVYTTKIGGTSGSVQEVITVTYIDNTKEDISTIERA